MPLIVKDRASKLYQFQLKSDLLSLHIGRKSVQLLATSSSDGYIRLWRLLNQRSPLLELNILQSVVKSGMNPAQLLGQEEVPSVGSAAVPALNVLCMCFDCNEELLVGGLENGSVLLWDLTKKKLVRSFQKAHSSRVTAIDFHPFGDYFATGSADHTLKVFDTSRKNCLQTYKGHLSTVACLRFTPDGRWLVSGDTQGSVKLWDLTAGKILTEFSEAHSGPVTCLDFHPTEFLLASGSTDGCIKYWDLDRFQLVSETPIMSTQSAQNTNNPSDAQQPDRITCVSFTPDGKYLLSISSSHLRAWSWEPSLLHDELPLEWNPIADFAINQGFKNGFGVSKKGPELAAWCVILEKLAPYKDGYVQPTKPPVGMQPKPKKRNQKSKADEEEEENAVISLSERRRRRRKLRKEKARKSRESDVDDSSDSSSNYQISKNTSEDTQKLLNQLRSSQFNMRSELRKAQRRQELEEKFAKRRSVESEPARSSPNKSDQADNLSQEGRMSSESKKERESPTKSPQQKVSDKAKNRHSVPLKKPFAARSSQPVTTDENGNVNHVVGVEPEPQKKLERSMSNPNLESSFEKHILGQHGGREDARNEAPKKRRAAVKSGETGDEMLRRISQGHHPMTTIISSRIASFKLVARLWQEGFRLEAIDHLCRLEDPAVTVDVMSHLSQSNHADFFTLQMCKRLLTLQVPLLESRFEPYLMSGLNTTQVLNKRFFGIIKQTLDAPQLGRNSKPVDARYNRCDRCRQLFLTLRGLLERLRKRHDHIGNTAENLHIQLSHYKRI